MWIVQTPIPDHVASSKNLRRTGCPIQKIQQVQKLRVVDGTQIWRSKTQTVRH